MDTRQLRLALLEERYLTVNVKIHPLAPLREELKKAGFVTSRELRRMPDGMRVKVAGRVVLVHTPPTRSGVRVMFITAEDEFGLIDMVMFPGEQRTFAKKVLSEPLCVFDGVVRKVGRKDVSVVIKWIENLLSAIDENRFRSTSTSAHTKYALYFPNNDCPDSERCGTRIFPLWLRRDSDSSGCGMP